MLKIRIFCPNTGSERGYLTSSGANGKISYIILLLCGFFPCCPAAYAPRSNLPDKEGMDLKKNTQHPRAYAKLKILFLMLADAVILNATNILTILVRLEFNLVNFEESPFLHNILIYAAVNTVCTWLIFKFFNIYKILWEYAGILEAFILAGACALSTSLQYVVMQTVLPNIMDIGPVVLPRSYPILAFLLFALAEALFRFSYRLRDMARISYGKKGSVSGKAATMLIGGGQAGALLLRDLQNNPYSSHNRVVCIIDDDPQKKGRFLNNIPIVGGRHAIPAMVEKYEIEEIIIAIPGATSQNRREIIEICQETNCRLRILPALYQLAGGEVSIQKIRDVEIEDLLGRDSVKVNVDEIMGYVSGKTVLVTGGGGSIGSELCRQIAKHAPKKLVIFDIYENNAYAIQQELLANHRELDLEVLIGSVRDADRVDMVFAQYRPDVVYHAAAHKHVPLMEKSPNEAIKNNVFGTKNVAAAADRYHSSVFVFISTDKAVNPTNIMGASKRLCEMLIQSYSHISKTKFVAVRFGNVLGSNGSVIPLFRKQIKAGGPVTVTHKDIIRYFMTIPEAVSLVLQAGAYARGGEIFILDMGKPVRIDDLARKMIKLSGFEPDTDIKIQYTGLRPGEKLYEELLMSEEGLKKTPNNLIFIGKLSDIDVDQFQKQLALLHQACEDNLANIKELVADIVPTYTIKDDK